MAKDAYSLDYEPILLKELTLECDISQGELARVTGMSRPAINLVVNRGYIPTRYEGFKSKIEEYLRQTPKAMHWLASRTLKAADVWRPAGKKLRYAMPAGTGKRSHASIRRLAVAPGDPDRITITTEVEMLSVEAAKHFKVFRNPFIDDVQKESDVFMSDEHRYIEAAMMDAAKHGGFLAVIGEVGSGKSIMRRRVVEKLRRDGDVLVIYPQIVDKTRVNASSLCDAIVMDISDQKPKIRLEQKTRQVQNLLMDRSKSGYRACLIVEEAHDLAAQTLKYLKRFHELEDGYKKLLGIILIGQPELKHFFNEAQHVEMREVIRRCQVAEIEGLNGHIHEYLEMKFKRVGGDVAKVFAEGAVKALSRRLTTKDREGRVISHAYPLLVNNHTARAMNAAYEMGEALVTEEIVMSI